MAQITPELIKAIIRTESNNNPNAVSPKGAIGLMQIMPATAAQYGVSPEQLRDPKVNQALGTRILTDLYNKYNGNLPAAISAYNEGSGALDKGRYPTETRNYLSRIMGFMGPSEASAGEIDPRIQKLMRNPQYIALTNSSDPADRAQAKRIMDTAQQRVAASPMDPTAMRFGASPSATPTPKATPTPAPQTFTQAMNQTMANQSFANFGPRIDQGLGKIKSTTAQLSNKAFGPNWGPTLDPGQLVPSTGPELAGQLAMTSMGLPGIFGGELPLSTYLEPAMTKAPGTIARLLVPPAVAAGTAAASGDPNTDPVSAGFTTFLGNTTGLGTEAAQKYALGKAGSTAVGTQLKKDTENIGERLFKIPNLISQKFPRQASEIIHYFTGTAEDKWGQYLRQADLAKSQADALEASLTKLKGAARTQAKAQIANLRQQFSQAMAAYNKRAKPFEALQKFFGRPESWEAEGYQEFLTNIPALQKFLMDARNVRLMRESGVPMNLIDDLRRLAWGKTPATVASQVMTERDIAAKSIGGGLRGHAYHGFPTFSSHLSFPEMAKLAGDRQKAIQANKMWGLVSGYLMDRYINSLGDPTEYGDSQATAGNTGMSEGPTGATH